MAIRSTEYLKEKFLNGKKPPQDDFHDWLDSFVHINNQVDALTDLNDFPANYTGTASKIVKVNATSTAVEFGRMTENADGIITVNKATADGSNALVVKNNNGVSNLFIKDTGDIISNAVYVNKDNIHGLAYDVGVFAAPGIKVSGNFAYIFTTAYFCPYNVGPSIGQLNRPFTNAFVKGGSSCFFTDNGDGNSYISVNKTRDDGALNNRTAFEIVHRNTGYINNNNFVIRNNSKTFFIVKSNYNVGIDVGETASEKLDVGGNIKLSKSVINTPSAIKTVNTTIDTADITGVLEVVGSGGNINCTSIAAGVNGQKMEIWGTSDTNTVTILSTTTNVKLDGGVSMVLGANDCITLRYRTTNGVNSWCEITRSNNL